MCRNGLSIASTRTRLVSGNKDVSKSWLFCFFLKCFGLVSMNVFLNSWLASSCLLHDRFYDASLIRGLLQERQDVFKSNITRAITIDPVAGSSLAVESLTGCGFSCVSRKKHVGKGVVLKMGWIWLKIHVKGVSFSDGLIVLSVICGEKACQGGMLVSRGKCCYL